MKKLILLIVIFFLASCDNNQDNCYRIVKYQKPNGDFVITQNVEVKCGTCDPIVKRKDATFVECVD